MRKAWVDKSYFWIPLAKRRPRVKRPIFIFISGGGPYRGYLDKITKLKKRRCMLSWCVEIDNEFETMKTFTGDGEEVFWMLLPLPMIDGNWSLINEEG
jgi:hypothetical protein